MTAEPRLAASQRPREALLAKALGEGTISEVAEKLDVAFALGWRSGSPLR